MEYSQVMLEMLERIKVLENKVKVLEEKSKAHLPLNRKRLYNLTRLAQNIEVWRNTCYRQTKQELRLPILK